MYRKLTLAAVLAAASAMPAFAGEAITIEDAYARATPGGRTGAAFFMIRNAAELDDRLTGARSDAAAKVELHTHLADADGVMRMRPIEGGIPVPAGGMHMLQRGGDHVMFMGLNGPWEDGGTVAVTLIFEKAGEVALEIPVDNARSPMSH